MSINSKLWLYAVAPVLAASIQLAGCTTEDSDPDGKGGSSSAGKGGGGGASGSGNSMGGGGGQAPVGSVCFSPTKIPAAATGIANFDSWDGMKAIPDYNEALNGDTSLNVYAGPFGYGDRMPGNKAETVAFVEGTGGTKYSLRVADSEAKEYGGGLGLWLSACIDASAFKGVSFWARGVAPNDGKATLKISLGDTMSTTPDANGKFGSCPGTEKLCIHPTYEFKVTDDWTEVKVTWAMFKPGDAAGTPVIPNGRNITQFGVDIGLKWSPDASGMYVPEPAAYELDVDSFTFY